MLDLSQINGKKLIEMVVGTLGIYTTYLLSGIFHEYMIKLKYYDDVTGESSNYQWPVGFLIFPCAVTWITGWIVNSFTIPESEVTHIPIAKSITCALTVFTSTITYTYAIYWTTFPIVMMFKSCNILSVILVGVLCSRVKEKKLKLGGKKIVVGIIVTAGIVLFKYYDGETGQKEDKQKTEMLGLLLLFISLLADGFLPDFQAEIKSVYKPQPMEMMEQINKWVCLLSLAVGIVIGDFYQIVLFMMTHFKFVAHMIAMGILSTLGQMFVYRMIKQFKQHIVPFVITTRKIITVGLSILYFGHATNYQQILGILLVFGIVTYEFISELSESHPAAHQTHNSLPVNNDLEIESQSQQTPLQTNEQLAQRQAGR